MKKLFITLAVAVVLVEGATAVIKAGKSPMNMHSMSSDESAPSQTIQTVPNQVDINNFDFSPMMMTVKKGTAVTWKNQDSAMHSIAFSSGPKAGTEGNLFGKDQTYTVMFSEAGTYDYHCRPHPYMKGKIKVEE